MKKNKYFTLLSLALGDGSIYNRKLLNGSKKACLDIAHHIKNSDYIDWKENILDELQIITRKTTKKNKTTSFSRLTTRGYELLEFIRKSLYKDKQKIFRRNWIRNLDIQSLAILWMDDGCLIRQYNKKKNYTYLCGEIATQSFDKQSNENIVLWLEKFGIKSYIIYNKKRNFYYIKMNRNNLFKLIEIISPYVNQIESMKYKILY